MSKKVRKAVRTFLIKNDKVIAIKYKTGINKDYYDIPGGKIEENESSYNASIREFKEETGIDIINQKYNGKVIIEYPERIFDIDIYIVHDYNGNPLDFEENDSMWVNMNDLFDLDKKFSTIEIIKYLYKENINLKIVSDKNHNIVNLKEHKDLDFLKNNN